MKRYTYYLWMVLVVFAFGACSDDDDQVETEMPEITEERGMDPGEEYTVEEGEKYLNVVYFVPQDVEPVADWHWRLSGIMNHVQGFYGNNLSKYYQVDQNFKLIRNVANPDYVKILLLRGSKPAAAYSSVYNIQYEVEEYFRTHAAGKKSHHTLILLPRYSGAPTGVAYGYDAVNIPNECYGIVACDYADFNIKYFRYTNLRSTYLSYLGEVVRAAGLAMGLTYNAPQKGEVYTSVTTGNSLTYVNNPDKWRLTVGDKEFLLHTELFQKEVDYSDIADVSIQNVQLKVENGNLVVDCMFSSTIIPDAFMVYNDFFRATDEGVFSEEKELMNDGMSTVKDAIMTTSTELISLGGNYYQARVEIPVNRIPDEYLKALPGQDYAKAELRFRILHRNGTCTPALMYAKCGNYYEDNQVHPDRFRYFYYLEALGVVEPLPYENHPDITSSPKNTWTITSENASGSLRYLFDDDVTMSVWNPRFSVENKPEFKMAFPSYVYIHGIKVHPGNRDDRAKKVSVEYYYYDFSSSQFRTVKIENYKLVGEGKYYYYIDFTKDSSTTYPVYWVKVTVEETCGLTTTSMAEVGIY